jgi:3-methylfumaryl-CoA hydratase
MFAGGEVVLHGQPEVGAPVSCESVVDSIQEKVGRSGRFAVVQVITKLRKPGGTVLVDERQDLVYRPAATFQTSSPTRSRLQR